MASRKRAPARRHFEDSENHIGYLLRIAFRSIVRALERRLSPFGVTSGQWRFLRVLWIEDGITQIELSRRFGMREPSTVAAIDGLERAGLVSRRKSSADRRKVHVHLTARARRLRDKVIPLIDEVNTLALKGVTRTQADAMRQGLLKVIANFNRDDGDSYQEGRLRAREVDIDD